MLILHLFQKNSSFNCKYFLSSFLICIPFITQFGCSSTVRTLEKKTTVPSKHVYRIVAAEKNQIRVLLAEEQKPILVKLQGKYKLISDNEETGKLKNGDNLKFQISNGGASVKFNSREIDGITFLLQPVDSESIVLFSGKKYSGDFLVVYSDNNRLLVIDRLPVEDYLLGVLPPEMAVKSNQPKRLEALKAFAVCARTFAEIKKVKWNTYFDITDDVRDQVFGGTRISTELDRQAIIATSNEVLKYNKKLAQVFYHSACGGILEDPANIFSGKVDNYLVSKKDGDENPNCEISPTFNWEESYTHSDLIKLLTAKNLLTKKQRVIKDIEISDTFTSGRVKEIRIKFSNADDVLLQASEIRKVFTRTDKKGMLRSSLFVLSKEIKKGKFKKVTLNGKGSGHGVGLCQWGAMNLSEKEKNYHEILDFYFHGCAIGIIE